MRGLIAGTVWEGDVMLHYLILLPVLYSFWLMLSGHLSPLFLILGALSSLLVISLQHRMDRIDSEPVLLKITPGILSYALWLCWSLLKANMDVARRIWDPKLPIDPVWERLDIKVTTPGEKTIYANSITLTPGTLTTDIQDDHFLIHTLTPENMDELRRGEMEERILKLRI